ncbi:hypothetical protein C1645_841426 [Glomus cerebriforme]|uniref:Uncharacterized protein n=1 Tax=Glomus cerebriforme TaxID=658196 RepID=A0A397S9Z6_9GLOM|nr:hypothetical protein C1645_841426 [Glomus cerebriforme]
MPAQLSTIIYVSDYREKTSSGFFIGTAALACTRLEEESDAVRDFNVIVFYPIDQSTIILKSATILDIPSKHLPVHK